jgi:chromosomal replication initiation ATPase DnaA
MNFQYLTSISNNNKMNDSNNFSNFVESESNRYKNSHYKNWTNETQRYSTSPNSDNFNIQVNTYENDE